VNEFAAPTRVRPTIRASGHNGLLYPATMFFLLRTVGAFGLVDQLIYGDAWYGKPGDKITQGVNLLGIATACFLFWLSRQQPARVGRVLPLAFAAFLITSAFWSADPRVAITQGTLYFFTVLGFIALVELWDVDALIGLIAKVIALCAVLSLIFGKHDEVGDFGGIFGQKNVLGHTMAVGVFACLHGWRTRHSLIYAVMAALCITLGVLSHSTTSLLVIAVFIAIDILGRLYLRGGGLRTLSVVGAVVGAAAAIFFFLNEAMFLEMLGKDSTLTGRTEIWPYAIANIYERPLFGWGYFGFWTPANPAASRIAEAIAFEHNTWYVALLPNAHNTWIEALLEIGIVGTTLLVILVARYLIAAVRCLNGPAKHLALSYFTLMSGLAILSYSEVMLLSPGTVTGLFFTVGMACEKKMWQYRHARNRRVRGTPPAPYTPRPARQTN
jgi:exopolysaccharide production protein ExoQ